MPLIVDPNASAAAGGAEPSAGAAGDLIKESDTQHFMADVIEASMQVPVIVDFWAPWCGPCRQLGPLLEKLVSQAAGAVRLVKVNVDENRELAMQLNVQSIPAVFAFAQGQPVDGFAGALPESQLRTFIDKLTGGAKPPIERAMEQAETALAGGDLATATAIFAEIVGQDPANTAALAGLIRCHAAGRSLVEARKLIDGMPEATRLQADIQAAIAALELVEESGATFDTNDLAARLERDPDDLEARFDLARAAFAAGDKETAIEQLIDLVRRDRHWNDAAARKQLVKIFDALGPTHPLTLDGRRRLSAILFS